MIRTLVACALSLLVASCRPEVRPEVAGLRATVPSVEVRGEDSQAVYRLEWTNPPGWFLIRQHLPLNVKYYSFLGNPCGEEGRMVPMCDAFFCREAAAQEYTLDLDVPFWARSMTLAVGRSKLIIECDLAD